MRQRTIIGLLLVAILAAAGLGYLVGGTNQQNHTVGILTFTRYQDITATTTTTTQTGSPPYNEFSGIMLNHLVLIAALNATAVSLEYAPNSSVRFEGLAGPFAGTYSPMANVSALWTTMFTQLGGITIDNFSATVIASPNRMAINSSFVFIQYYKPNVGTPPRYAVVAAYAVFIRLGSSWLISTETWRFYSYPLSYP